jgi:glucoamylase
MQDMQYVITDGSTFVDLERDATSHATSMPTEKALEYTVTNTDTRQQPKYRITNTYITDPSRDTLLIQTRFESLDGGFFRLYLLANPSMASGGADNSAWWDRTTSALMASGTRSLFGSPTTVVSALKVGTPNGFVVNDNGYAAMASDCNVELRTHMALVSRFDSASNGNVLQCGEIGSVGADTTFTVALGYGDDAATALAAANGSLAAGFAIGKPLTVKAGATTWAGCACPVHRLVGHAAAAGLLCRGDGAARRRGQDIPRRQRCKLRHAMG